MNRQIVSMPHRPITRADEFEKFDREHPHVYRELVRLTRELVDEGHAKIGFELVYNVARWVLRTETATEGLTYRLNDIWGSFYARKIMAENVDLFGVFDLRRAEHADPWAAARWPGVYGRIAS